MRAYYFHYFHFPLRHIVFILPYSKEILFSFFIRSGKTEMSFEIPLKPQGNKQLFETYHGVFINIQVCMLIHL